MQTQLLGKYRFPDGSVVGEVNVIFESGSLMMNSSAGVSALELIKGDSFNVVNFNGTAVFKRNAAKKVIGVHIDASGYVLDGVKDSVSITMTDVTVGRVALSANHKWKKNTIDGMVANDFSFQPANDVLFNSRHFQYTVIARPGSLLLCGKRKC